MTTRLVLLGLTATLGIAAAPVGDTARVEKAADNPDKMICKRFPVLGSLVETEKVCQTKREWENTRSNLYQRGGVGQCAGPSSDAGGFCGN